MVVKLNSKTILVTPGLRLVDVLEEAAVSPVLLESGGTIYRLSKDSEGTEPERDARSDELLPVQMRDEQLCRQATAPTTEIERVVVPAPRMGESFRDFFMRTRAEEIARGEIDGNPAALTPEQEEQVAAMDRIWQRRQEIFRKHGLLDDSTELIRRDREERSRHLAEL